MKKILVILVCVFFTSGVYAKCVSNGRGAAACGGNGNGAVGVNTNTGTAVRVQTNSAGVTRTETSNGGQAVTKNGVGVVKGPGGTTCVKTRHNQGCN